MYAAPFFLAEYRGRGEKAEKRVFRYAGLL